MRGFLLLSLSLCLTSSMAMAQSTTTTTTTSSTTSNAAQAQAIQQQITAGIENGTLSATQIQELQAQELQLQAATAASANRLAGTAHVTPDATDLAAQRFSQAVRSTNSGARTNATGPDPFTYNTLGPDAYAAQKYQNPQYNVPAYPTTNPVPSGVTQQYSGASAGSPYGAGYAQSPLPSGTGQNVYAPGAATGTTAATGQGVYVYRTGQGR